MQRRQLVAPVALTVVATIFAYQTCNKSMKKKQQAGFSLIELLVVATIILVLTTIGIVSYRRANTNSRDAKRKSDLQAVRQALILYKAENGCYPGPSEGTVEDLVSEEGALYDYVGTEDIADPSGGTYAYEASGSCGGGSGYIEFRMMADLETDGYYFVYNP
ncbi:MAG: prepilin-type N-terminal cleavage/methylation domain-containing protein [Candidatus Pacebacteria bacterium]|nr:prepilin-type N-terminal cleavage/methylation domain-containing protein [Candidatus Paceibacterota bacterium]